MRILWCTIVVLSFVNLLLAEEIIAPNKDSSVNDASAKPVGNAEPSEPVISAAPSGPVSGNVASAEPVSNVAPAEPVFGSAPTVPVINSAAAPAVVVTSAVPNAPGFNAAPVGQEYSFSIHLDKADQHHLVNVQYSHPNPNIGNSLNNGEKASIEEGAGEWTNQPLTFVSSAAAVPDSSVPKVPTRPLIAGLQKETVDSFAVPYSSQSGYYQPSSPAIPISAFRIYNSNKYGQPTSQSFRTPSSESNEYPKSIVYQHGSYLVPSSQAGYVQSDRAAHSYPSYTTYSVGGENSGHLYNSEENQQAIEKFTREIPANHKAVDDETISRRSDKNQQINAKFSPAIPLTYEHLKPEEYQSIVNGVNNKQSFRYSPSVEPQNESTRYSSISQTPADTYYLLPAGNPEISKVITNYYKSPQAESWTIRQSPANVQYVPTTRLSSITQSPVKTLNSPSAAYSVNTDNPAYQSIFAKHSAIVQSPVKSYYSSPVGYETVPLKSFNKYYTPSEAYSKEYSAQSNLPTISYYSPSTGDFADKQKSAITYYLSPYSSKTESPSTSYYPSSAWNYESSPAVQPAYSRAGYQGFNVFPNDPYNTAAAAPVAQEYLVAEETQKGYSGQSQNSPASLLLHKSAQLAPSQSSPAVSYLSVGHQGYNVFPHDPYSKINQQVYQQYSLAAPTTQEYLESEESENVYPGQVQSSPASSFVIKNAHYLPAQSSPAIGYSSVGYQGYNVFPNDPYSKINQQAYQQYSPAVPAANEYSVSEESQSVYPGQTQYSPSSLLAHKNAQAASSQSPPAVSYASEGYQGYNVFPNDPYSKVNQQVYQQYSPAASTSYGYLGSKQSSNSYLSQPQYSLQTPQYHKLANFVAQLSPASNSEYVGHYGYNVFPSDPYSKLSQQVYQEYSPAAPVAQDYSDSSDTQNVYQGFYQYAPPSAGYQKIVGSGSLQYSPSVSPVNKYAGHYGFNVLPSEPYPQYSPAAPGTSEYSEYSQSVPAVHQKPAIYSPAAQSFGSNLSQKQTTKLQPIVVAEQSGEYLGPEEAQQIAYSSNHIPPKRAAFDKPSSDEETKEKEIASTVAVHE